MNHLIAQLLRQVLKPKFKLTWVLYSFSEREHFRSQRGKKLDFYKISRNNPWRAWLLKVKRHHSFQQFSGWENFTETDILITRDRASWRCTTSLFCSTLLCMQLQVSTDWTEYPAVSPVTDLVSQFLPKVLPLQSFTVGSDQQRLSCKASQARTWY